MSRNYKKEREWQLNKYDQIRANIDKDLGTALRKKLKQNERTIASWITENAKKYLNDEENKNTGKERILYRFFLFLCILCYNYNNLLEICPRNQKK